mgnify:CR=1 FL=1
MSAPVGATVTLAVGQLSALARAGRLDLELFARSCEGALMGSKANALAALTILRGGLSSAESADLEGLLGVALSFPHAQVQALAIDLASDALRSGLLGSAVVGRLLSDAELDPLVVATLDLLDPGHAATDQADPGLVPEDDPGEQAPAAFLPPPREVADLVPMSADDVSGRVGVLAQGAQMGLEYEALLAFLASPEFDPSALESLRPLVRRLTTRRLHCILRTAIARNSPADSPRWGRGGC